MSQPANRASISRLLEQRDRLKEENLTLRMRLGRLQAVAETICNPTVWPDPAAARDYLRDALARFKDGDGDG